MTTLRENLKLWWARYATMPGQQHCFVVGRDGFLAGAKAEREEGHKRLKPLLEAVKASLHSEDDYDLEADYMRLRDELAVAYRDYLNERRIKARESGEAI